MMKPLTHDELLEASHAPALPGCSDPCEQGRRACPCPEACQRDDSLDAAHGVVMGVALAFVLWGLLALAALLVAEWLW